MSKLIKNVNIGESSSLKITRIRENKDAFIDNNDFWTNWKIHRDIISNNIKKHIVDPYKFETIAIWGAGKCNDLDLKFFCAEFKEVHLFDFEDENVKNGVEFQELTDEQLERIVIHPGFDFVGIDTDFYERIENMLIQKESSKAIIKYIRATANRLDSSEVIKHVKLKFDVSISIGVHSQIFSKVYLLLDKYLNHYGEENSIKVYEEIRYLYRVGVKVYNEFLYNTVKEGGVLYAGFDMLEFSSHLNTLNLLPKFNELMETGEVLKHYQSFANHCAVMGSIEGSTDLSKYMKEEKSKLPLNYWLWKYFDFQSYFFITMGFVK